MCVFSFLKIIWLLFVNTYLHLVFKFSKLFLGYHNKIIKQSYDVLENPWNLNRQKKIKPLEISPSPKIWQRFLIFSCLEKLKFRPFFSALSTARESKNIKIPIGLDPVAETHAARQRALQIIYRSCRLISHLKNV